LGRFPNIGKWGDRPVEIAGAVSQGLTDGSQASTLKKLTICYQYKPKETPMKVRINKQCMGDRNCNKLCPEVFGYDEDQLLAIVKFDEIPEKYHDLVRQAAQECVPQAIEIEE
jgi:ferredoxin